MVDSRKSIIWPFHSCFSSRLGAQLASVIMSVVVTWSSQVLARLTIMSVVPGMLKPLSVNQNSGHLMYIDVTWKVNSFDNHTSLSRRALLSSFKMSWIKNVYGWLSLLGRVGSLFEGATATDVIPIISLAAAARACAMCW